MLTTKTLVTSVNEVPETWIFEKFAGLSERLNGNRVKIKSLFNPLDRKPSMYIFWSFKLGKYWFHDFSSGKSGNCIKLVQELHQNCSYADACRIIESEYSKFLKNDIYLPSQFNLPKKYRVSNYAIRNWNNLDAGFWTSYNIGSNLLDKYCVIPLSEYEMADENNPADHFTVSGDYIYGYFTADGKLYKIYRPKSLNSRFLKVRDYVQGLDQLQDKKCLLIVSSLKDGLSLCSLDLDVDFIAPDSESVMLPAELIYNLYDRYNGYIFSLLDNDKTGIKAMRKYKEKYLIKPILLTLSKDISDSCRDHGPISVRNNLVPKIDLKFNLSISA